jgi:pilus assembly protein CpaB
MNTARIVVLTITLSAGCTTACLASGSDDKLLPTKPIAHLKTVGLLATESGNGLGQSVDADDFQQQIWPAATANNGFIRRNERPDATTTIQKWPKGRTI